MYNVFLVEDEIVTREGIRNCIDWDNSPYHFTGEAPDGEMALHALKDIKPDILITDIKMPFLDGLSLARMVKKDQPWMKIVILSGHDEFEYAKEAISIGVDEYLLKPVSSEEMQKTLGKISESIEKEKRQKRNLEQLQERVLSGERVLRNRWLEQFITGQSGVQNQVESAGEKNIDLLPGPYSVINILLNANGIDYRQLALGRQLISDYCDKQENLFYCSLGLEKQTILVKGLPREEAEDSLYIVAQGIKFEVERNSSCSVSVGIGPLVNYSREIPESFSLADRVIRYMRLTGKSLILGTGDIPGDYSILNSRKQEGMLQQQLRKVEPDSIKKLVNTYLILIGKEDSQAFFHFLNEDLKQAVSELLEPFSASVDSLFPELIQTGNDFPQSETEKRELLLALFQRWIEYRDMHQHDKHGLTLLKAREYIKQNYFCQDISLESVASYVNLSPNHFSTVFSQETGKTFIEYLTAVRIKKAKELLTGSKMKCGDISYEVGYGDPHYFSFLFKKKTGTSPSEYRSING